jgi:hypothetical protein
MQSKLHALLFSLGFISEQMLDAQLILLSHLMPLFQNLI